MWYAEGLRRASMRSSFFAFVSFAPCVFAALVLSLIAFDRYSLCCFASLAFFAFFGLVCFLRITYCVRTIFLFFLFYCCIAFLISCDFLCSVFRYFTFRFSLYFPFGCFFSRQEHRWRRFRRRRRGRLEKRQRAGVQESFCGVRVVRPQLLPAPKTAVVKKKSLVFFFNVDKKDTFFELWGQRFRQNCCFHCTL